MANERVRFSEVVALLKEMGVSQNTGVKGGKPCAKELRERFADGKWHSFDAIVSTLAAPKDDVFSILEHYKKLSHGAYKCERKQVGKAFHYRLFPKEHVISSLELMEKLGPIFNVIHVADSSRPAYGPAQEAPGYTNAQRWPPALVPLAVQTLHPPTRNKCAA